MKFIKLNNQEIAACEILAGIVPSVKIDDDFYKFAKVNQIDSIVGHLVKYSKIIVNDELRELLINEHNNIKRYMEDYLVEIDNVAEIFFKNGIDVVALKNGGIARGIYSCRGCCPMGDMDLLVKKEDFLKAHNLLLENEYRFKYRFKYLQENIKNALTVGSTEYWKKLKTGETVWLELQFRSVAGRWISLEQEPDSSSMIDRAEYIKGSKVKLLSPEDNLLQVALHTAKHTYVKEPGIRLHTDVDRIVRLQKVDWDIFITKVIKYKVKTAVYFSLLIPYEIFNSPIPESVLKRLAPRRIKHLVIINMLNKAGLFNPGNKKFGKISYFIINLLLYDSFGIILRHIIPDKKVISEMYSCRMIMLPFYYIKRIADIAMKRNKT